MSAAIKTLDAKLLAGLPSGTWVAISSDQDSVIATGHTMEETLKAAQKRGVQQPYIVRVPVEESTLIL
jgi:hypothetical protein